MPADLVTPLLDSNRTYAPAIIAAVRSFKRSKPWRGTSEERKAKFQKLNEELCAACENKPATIRWLDESIRGGKWNAEERAIEIGKLSVVTFLNIFCYSCGEQDAHGEPRPAIGVREAYAWSVNLFARMFPVSYASASHVGPCIVQD